MVWLIVGLVIGSVDNRLAVTSPPQPQPSRAAGRRPNTRAWR
ncbi:hypothetical protein yberc0001_5710, partial [Yersinia bercovieri ATCC 43970]